MAKKAKKGFDLKAAIADAKRNDEIALPGTTIALRETLTIDKPVTLVGKRNKTRIESTAAVAVIQISANVTLRDVTVTRTGRTGDVVQIKSGRVELERIRVKGAKPAKGDDESGNGMLIAGKSKVSVTRCDASHNKAVGIYVADQAEASIEDTTVASNLAGIFACSKARLEVKGCKATGNKHGGVSVMEKAQARVFDSQLNGNGVGLTAWQGASVHAEGNTCDKNENGIAISRGAKGVVANNRCRKNKRAGLSVYEDGTIDAQDNELSENGWHGMTLIDARGELRGNVCEKNKMCGAMIMGGTTATLDGNRFARNKLNGVEIKDAASPTVRNNHLNGNGSAGVAVSGEASPRVEGNECNDNKVYGLWLFEKSRGTFTRNECQRNASDGVLITGSAAPVLDGNVLEQNKGSGVEIHKQAGGTLRANRVGKNKGHGVALVNDAGVVLLDRNECRDNKEGDLYIDDEVDESTLMLTDNSFANLEDADRYHVDVGEEATRKRVPKLLLDFAAWLGTRRRGWLGYFDALALEAGPTGGYPDYAERLRASVSFLRLGEGSELAIVEAGRQRPVVMLGSEGELTTVANSVAELLHAWADGETGVFDLDDEEAQGRAQLAAWLRSKKVKKPAATRAFDFAGWLDGASGKPKKTKARKRKSKKADTPLSRLVAAMGRRADDPALVEYVTEELGKSVPATMRESSDLKYVTAAKLGLELGFHWDVLHTSYPPIQKTKKSFVPYLKIAWVRDKFPDALPVNDLGEPDGVWMFGDREIPYWTRPLDASRDIVLHVRGKQTTVELDAARNLSRRWAAKPEPQAGAFIAWAIRRGVFDASQLGEHAELIEAIAAGKEDGTALMSAAMPRGLWDRHLVKNHRLWDHAYRYFHNVGDHGIDKDHKKHGKKVDKIFDKRFAAFV